MFRSNIAGQSSVIVIKFYQIHENFCYRRCSLNLDHKKMTSVTVSEQHPSTSTVPDVNSVIGSKRVWPVVKNFHFGFDIGSSTSAPSKNHWRQRKMSTGYIFQPRRNGRPEFKPYSSSCFIQGIYESKEWVLDVLLFSNV